MCAARRFSCPSFFHPSTKRRMYKLLSNGLITPRTQKAISSLKEQLRGGEKGTHCLIFVVKSNTVMSHGPFDQDGEGSSAECRSWTVAASNRASRSSASVVTRVRLVRAPSISLLARSLP